MDSEYVDWKQYPQLNVNDEYVGDVGCTQCMGFGGSLETHDNKFHDAVKDAIDDMLVHMSRYVDVPQHRKKEVFLPSIVLSISHKIYGSTAMPSILPYWKNHDNKQD